MSIYVMIFSDCLKCYEKYIKVLKLVVVGILMCVVGLIFEVKGFRVLVGS